MKLLGVSNGEKVIASVARYDYVALGEGDQSIMMDGGILNLTDNGGCFRYRGKLTWLEVPQNLAELYNDWRESRRGKWIIWWISMALWMSQNHLLKDKAS